MISSRLQRYSAQQQQQQRSHEGQDINDPVSDPVVLLCYYSWCFNTVISMSARRDSLGVAAAVGFFFLQELWGWLEPYMDDEEEFKPSPTEGNMTMGQFVRKIIRFVSSLTLYPSLVPRLHAGISSLCLSVCL